MNKKIMQTTINRSDACKFANHVTDLIQLGELQKSKDGKYWATHDHFDDWMADQSKLIHKKQLIAFAHYLFSDKRREQFSNHPEFGDKNLDQRLMSVHRSDIENWMESQK